MTTPTQPQTTPPATGSAAGESVTLADVQRMLADERAAREALAATLAEERQARYVADMDTFLDDLVRERFVPPASLAPFRRILRTLKPDAPGIISLSDDEGAPLLNLADAIKQALNELVPPDLKRPRTRPSDVRPTERYLAEAEQVAEAHDALGKQLAAEANAARHRNGTAAH